MFPTEYLWLIAVAGAPVAIGLAILYARLRQRRIGPAEKARQDKATRELYRSDSPR
jgi:NADH:ubiquinone oxidoreductase subunit K